jgi:hypothetical protein
MGVGGDDFRLRRGDRRQWSPAPRSPLNAGPERRRRVGRLPFRYNLTLPWRPAFFAHCDEPVTLMMLTLNLGTVLSAPRVAL